MAMTASSLATLPAAAACSCAFDVSAASGANYTHVFASAGLLKSDGKTPTDANKDAVLGFDELLKKVDDFNKNHAGSEIKLMMTLTNCVNDYGGLQQYVRWGVVTAVKMSCKNCFKLTDVTQDR
jgi:hypothetical protein